WNAVRPSHDPTASGRWTAWAWRASSRKVAWKTSSAVCCSPTTRRARASTRGPCRWTRAADALSSWAATERRSRRGAAAARGGGRGGGAERRGRVAEGGVRGGGHGGPLGGGGRCHYRGPPAGNRRSFFRESGAPIRAQNLAQKRSA